MCITFLKNIIESLGSKPGVPVTGQQENSHTEEDETVSEVENTPEEPKPYSGTSFHVLLDNGHASSTPGKRQQLDNGKYFFEYEFNRDVVARIASGLEALGIPFEILVPETDDDIPLSTRAARANSFCDKYGTKNCLFISVHANAFGDGKTFTSARGWSVFTTKGETSADKYATIFYEEAAKILPVYGMTLRSDLQDGDPDYEANFTVLAKTKCPALLTENLFFTNREDVAWLQTSEGRDMISKIHINGIRRIIDDRDR